MREQLHPHVWNMNMIIKLKEKCVLASKEKKLKLLICYLVYGQKRDCEEFKVTLLCEIGN